MGSRLDLQLLLEELINSANVYFQPPPTVQMAYPCIVYKLDNADQMFADNGTYRHTWRYQVTAISRDPDMDIPAKLASLPHSSVSQFYTANNLYHFAFSVYF